VDGGGFQVVKAADGYLYGQFESLKHLDALVAWFDLFLNVSQGSALSMLGFAFDCAWTRGKAKWMMLNLQLARTGKRSAHSISWHKHAGLAFGISPLNL
jgi:hypothetical protein